MIYYGHCLSVVGLLPSISVLMTGNIKISFLFSHCLSMVARTSAFLLDVHRLWGSVIEPLSITLAQGVLLVECDPPERNP